MADRIDRDPPNYYAGSGIQHADQNQYYQQYGRHSFAAQSRHSHGSGISAYYSYQQSDPGHPDYKQQDWDVSSATSATSEKGLLYQQSQRPSWEVADYLLTPVYNAVPPGGIYQYLERTMDISTSPDYARAMEKMMKGRSVMMVPLQQGNLVLDVPVPSHIVLNGATSDEMTKMRYTAATCDPDDFVRNNYSLRQHLYCRQTELFIVITMYNEDEELFVKTMNAVVKNVGHLCSRTGSQTWGPGGWKNVVVCVVADGRNEINQRTLKVLSLMGCYQEGIPKDTVGGKDVTAHIFEFTSQVVVSETGEVSAGSCPVQILFCLKEQNKKKLNSHRWFFNAFGPLIKPNVCILLDVGTKPTGTSLYELWKCFDRCSGVGGACGEVCVDTGESRSVLFGSPLVAAQNFEYKISNILDKPLESVFGYISVLPGAFSAYRYKALQNLPDGTGPLASYFKGELLHGGGDHATGGLFERNMYLAEDRILSFEIVTKKQEAWTLRYVKSAKASTDVPTTVPEFISQRRRWLNGAFFAALHATVHFYRIWTSGQGFFRKIWLQLEFIYNAVQLLVSWTALANLYLAFFFLAQSATSDRDGAFNFLSQNVGQTLFDIVLKLDIFLLFAIVICSLGTRPHGSKWMYTAGIFLFGFCNVVTIWCGTWTIYLTVPHTLAGWSNVNKLLADEGFRDIAIAFLATYGVYFFSSILYFEPRHMFTSMIQYMLLLPTYVNILMVYAMCNLHDIAWGTKGDNGAVKNLGSANKVKGDDGKEMLEVQLPTVREDVDALWDANRKALRQKPPPQIVHLDAVTKQTDHDRNTRTNVVLVWVATNAAMILVFTSTGFKNWAEAASGRAGGSPFNPYLVFLFYALASLNSVRFLGSTAYVILGLFGH